MCSGKDLYIEKWTLRTGQILDVFWQDLCIKKWTSRGGNNIWRTGQILDVLWQELYVKSGLGRQGIILGGPGKILLDVFWQEFIRRKMNLEDREENLMCSGGNNNTGWQGNRQYLNFALKTPVYFGRADAGFGDDT